MKISKPKLKKIILQEAKKVLKESVRPEADYASVMDRMLSYGKEDDDYADSEDESDDFYSGIEKYSEDDEEHNDEDSDYEEEEKDY